MVLGISGLFSICLDAQGHIRLASAKQHSRARICFAIDYTCCTKYITGNRINQHRRSRLSLYFRSPAEGMLLLASLTDLLLDNS
jgi:hypothetical protein